MGLLSRLMQRAALGANDRGLLRRAMAAGDDFMDAPSPGYVRGVSRRADMNTDAINWNLDAAEQEALDSLPPLTRARALAESGEGHALSAYERALLRRGDPQGASRLLWRMDAPQEAQLDFAPNFAPADDLRGMFRADGELASPEAFLGRPLTPDHIWNDPRFARRMAATADLEGIKTPEQRFYIAEWRERGDRGPDATS